jgi:hypothetical protein
MRLIWHSVAVLCVLAALSPFLLPHIPVGTDLPKHVMVARVVASFDEARYGYANHFSLELRPRPTILGALTLAGLVKALDPFDAAKAYLALFVVGLWLSGRFLAVRAGQPPLAGLLLLPLAHTFYVFAGFMPFIGAIPFFAILLGVLIKRPGGLRRSVWICVLTLVLYGFHIVGLAAGCFAVVMFAFDRKDGWRVAWSDLAALVPAVSFAGYYLAYKRPQSSTWYYYGPLGQIKAYIGYNAWTLSRVGGVLFIGLIVALAAFVAWQAYRQPKKPRLLLLMFAMTVTGLLSPYQIGDWFVVGSRTFPFVVVASLAFLRFSQRSSRILATVVAGFLAASGWFNTRAALNVQEAYRIFLSGIPAMEYGARMLPVVEDDSAGGNQYIQPFAGIEDAYNIYRGGSNPYCFSAPWVKTGGVILRSKYPSDYAFKYSTRTPDYRGASREYNCVVLFGKLPEVARVVANEMCLGFSNGPLSVYRPCGAAERRSGLPGAGPKRAYREIEPEEAASQSAQAGEAGIHPAPHFPARLPDAMGRGDGPLHSRLSRGTQ